MSALVIGILLWQLGQISRQLDTATFWAGVTSPRQYWRIALVILLMPVNWLLETLKWQLLLRPFLTWSFTRCWLAVMAGVSLSAATPNRIGEIGGRLLMANKQEVPGVLASSLLGGLCQWLVFLVLGLPALIWSIGPFLPASLQGFHWLVLIIIPIVFIGLSYGGLRLSLRLIGWVERKFQRSFDKMKSALGRVSASLLAWASLLAAARFCVYVTQLYLLLHVFGLSLPLWSGLAGIAAIYLVQAGLPLPPGINLITRAEFGVLLWGNDPVTVAASLAAFTSLFLVNVLLPALPAYWLVVKKIKLDTSN